jgi:hypothetical protein
MSGVPEPGCQHRLLSPFSLMAEISGLLSIMPVQGTGGTGCVPATPSGSSLSGTKKPERGIVNAATDALIPEKTVLSYSCVLFIHYRIREPDRVCGPPCCSNLNTPAKLVLCQEPDQVQPKCVVCGNICPLRYPNTVIRDF